MFTINSILKEMKDIPVSRLEDLYYFVHTLNNSSKISESRRKKIMAFAGAFSDMSEQEYKDFQKEMKKTRESLFNRNAES